MKHIALTAASAAVILVQALSLAFCETSAAVSQDPWDLDRMTIDPLLCTTVPLRKDIAVRKEIIHEPSVMGNRFLIVLRYREGGDEKEPTPDLLGGYVNVSLVSEVEGGVDTPLIVHRRWCVFEMWKFHPERREKLCILWTISDARASLKVLREDFGGRFLAERNIPLDASHLARLRAFYRQTARALVDMLKEPPSST